MEIYLHLKDVLKQLSKAPITVEFSDSSLQKDLIVCSISNIVVFS